MKKWMVTASPHVRSGDTVTGIMLDVIIALLPALIAAVRIFGFRALLVVAVSVASCVLTEYVSRKIMKRENTIGDLSAVVTGILLAYNLPVDIPLWMVVFGAIAAIAVVKQMFGGLGQNFVNPAITGRIVLLVSFPTAMTTFAKPLAWAQGADAVTTATPLASLSQIDLGGNIAAQMNSLSLPTMSQMFFGLIGGSLGEVCTVALLIGGLYLWARHVVSPIVPVSFIGTVAVIMLIAGKGNFSFMAYELFSGGLMLGAIFMATDYATSPVSRAGKILFGIGCGIITSVIRLFSNLPEGVSYAIMIMNIVTPLIDRVTLPKPFGTVKEKKEKAEA